MLSGLYGLQLHSMNVALLQSLFQGVRIRITQIKGEINPKACYLSLNKSHGVEKK